MAQLNPQLTRRTVVLIKKETTPGTDPVPSPTTDGLLVEAPDFTVDSTELERDFVRNDLSPIGYRTGRIIAHCKFMLEMRGNGQEQSGLIGNAPVWGRCLRGCGLSETAIPTAAFGNVGSIRDMLTNGTSGIAVTWAVAGTYAAGPYYDYQIVCVVGGASATAKFRVDELNGYDPLLLSNETISIDSTNQSGTATIVVGGTALAPTITFSTSGWTAGDQVNFNVNGFVGLYVVGATPTGTTVANAVAAIIAAFSGLFTGTTNTAAVINITYTGAAAGTGVITSGSTAITLGTSAITVTPTWSGNVDAGHVWKVSVSPPGIQYQPISYNFEFFTIYIYMDGTLKKMTACQGTFSFSASAGNYGKFTFEMSGNYIDTLDAILPSPVLLVNPVPPIFALAQLRLYSENITINEFTYTHGNTVAPRDDANSANGYYGVRITGRKPTGGVDPEATQTGDFDYWKRLSDSTYMQMSCLWGATPGTLNGVAGNSIWFKAPNVQSTKTTYKDRQGIRTYDMGLGFAREAGDDEIRLLFA